MICLENIEKIIKSSANDYIRKSLKEFPHIITVVNQPNLAFALCNKM